jgi:hypothetical protein
MVDHLFRMHLTRLTKVEECYSGEVEATPRGRELFALPEVSPDTPIRETPFYQFLACSQPMLSTIFYEDLCLFVPELTIGIHKLAEGQFNTYKLIHSEFCYRMLRNLPL